MAASYFRCGTLRGRINDGQESGPHIRLPGRSEYSHCIARRWGSCG